MLKKLVFEMNQPFGRFYVTKFKASELLKFAFSDSIRRSEDGSDGIQRPLDPNRTGEIQDYIRSKNCAFPNSIILAANISPEGFVMDEEKSIWSLESRDNGPDGENYMLIPKVAKMATIIDGQHRLFGFDRFSESELQEYDTELL